MNSAFLLGADGVYRCVAFDNQFPWQRHGFGTRVANPKADVTLRQIHSAAVVNAGGLSDRAQEGDALITDEIDRTIGIRTADCVPILMLDSKSYAVAAVHAGWRGTAAEIVQHAVQELGNTFETDPAFVYAAIGPCIRACCYEVGPEVASQFHPLFPEWEAFAGKRKLDLAEANRRQLQAAGVHADRIYDCGRCTACESDLFYSYRRDPQDPARMVASICRRS